VRFPYSEPYPSQKAFMSKVLNALNAKHNALLESPTGTGKTLALLCSSLAWQSKERLDSAALFSKDFEEHVPVLIKKSVPKIYFASRTHSQLKQVVAELRRTGYGPKITILASREHYCINPDVADSRKGDKNELCKTLVSRSACRFFHGARRVSSEEGIWDIEDLVSTGRKRTGCPYFASRDMLEEAEFVLVTYNHLLDPGVRKSSSIVLKDAVVILDEAHNIEDVARSAASKEFALDQLKACVDDLDRIVKAGHHVDIHNSLFELTLKMFDWLNVVCETLQVHTFEKESRVFRTNYILELFTSFGVNSNNVKDYIKRIDSAFDINSEASSASMDVNQEEAQIFLLSSTIQVLTSLGIVLDFFFRTINERADDYRLVVMKSPFQNSRTQWEVKACFWSMNPSIAFRDMSKNCRSVILTSGTLSPLKSFEAELGVPFYEKLEASHVIPVDQIAVHRISSGPKNIPLNAVFKNTDSFAFQDEVGETLLSIVEVVPSGTLVFFPSYSLMDRLMSRWRATGLLGTIQMVSDVHAEKRSAEAYKEELNRYFKCINANQNGVFFAVCRGKLSEGIDFADKYARAVVVIGIPYPHLKDLNVSLKKQYNDEKKKTVSSCISGNEWYELQAYRAVNQAMGRCIRHIRDFGAIILVDERFLRPNVCSCLSRWVQNVINVSGNAPSTFHSFVLSLQTFFEAMSKLPVSQELQNPDALSVMIENRVPDDIDQDDVSTVVGASESPKSNEIEAALTESNSSAMDQVLGSDHVSSAQRESTSLQTSTSYQCNCGQNLVTFKDQDRVKRVRFEFADNEECYRVPSDSCDLTSLVPLSLGHLEHLDVPKTLATTPVWCPGEFSLLVCKVRLPSSRVFMSRRTVIVSEGS